MSVCCGAGERAAADVPRVGVPGHDGAAAAVGDLARGGAAAGRALGQHHRVELAHPGPAARHHDVLPRLRAAALRPAPLMPTGSPTPATGFSNLFLKNLPILFVKYLLLMIWIDSLSGAMWTSFV